MCSQENAPPLFFPSSSRRDRLACPVNMSSLRDSEERGEIPCCYKHAIPPGLKRKNIIFQTASKSAVFREFRGLHSRNNMKPGIPQMSYFGNIDGRLLI